MSPRLTTAPTFSFGTVSGVPPLANVTTGVPQAIASMLTSDRASSSDGLTNMSDILYMEAIFDGFRILSIVAMPILLR